MRRARWMVPLVAFALLAAACGGAQQPTETTPAGDQAAADFKACMVTDIGGVDDKSFNATSWAGMQIAEEELGVEVTFLESQSEADYVPNIRSLMEQDCGIIVTVGFLLADATQQMAQENPDQLFAIVDFAYDPPLDNVLGLTFQTDEAAFLAGYVSAAVTQTGAVGAFGGINIPTVTIFMDGFARGVQHHNEQKGTDVQVLGWDPETQEGLFTGNFESLEDGRAFGQNLIDEGADIIMPVAGPVGLGTAAVAQESEGIKIVGVDTDWCVSAAEFCDVVLTSAEKKMDVAVFEAVQRAVEGTFEGGVYLGTLENEGVGISPFHELEAEVPEEVSTELEDIRQGIIAGEIQVGG